MKKPINFAIVGCGRISDLHAPHYLQNPNANLLAVCDEDIERATLKANEWGIKKEQIYSEFQTLLKNPDIDAIDLLVPHHLHAPMTIEALEAGKHVSVQKPMANSLRECDQMIHSARDTGLKLRILENFRFYPPYLLAMDLIKQGKLGRVSSIHIKLGAGSGGWEVPIESWIWRFDESLSGGGEFTWDDGYHKWSIARWFLGDVESIIGYLDYTGLVEDDENAILDAPASFVWKYKQPRTLGSFEIAYMRDAKFPSSYYSADERVELSGDKGYIWINQCSAKSVKQEAPVVSHIEGELTEYHDVESDWLFSFKNAINHFIKAILNDFQPEVTPLEAKKIQQLAMAAIRSTQTKKLEYPEKIQDLDK